MTKTRCYLPWLESQGPRITLSGMSYLLHCNFIVFLLFTCVRTVKKVAVDSDEEEEEYNSEWVSCIAVHSLVDISCFYLKVISGLSRTGSTPRKALRARVSLFWVISALRRKLSKVTLQTRWKRCPHLQGITFSIYICDLHLTACSELCPDVCEVTSKAELQRKLLSTYTGDLPPLK